MFAVIIAIALYLCTCAGTVVKSTQSSAGLAVAELAGSSQASDVGSIENEQHVALLLSGSCDGVQFQLSAAVSRLRAMYRVDAYAALHHETGISAEECRAAAISALHPVAVDVAAADGRLSLADQRFWALGRAFDLFLSHRPAQTPVSWLIHHSVDVIFGRLPNLARLEPGYMYLPDHVPSMELPLGWFDWASPTSFAILPPPGTLGCAACAETFMRAGEGITAPSAMHPLVWDSVRVRTSLREAGLLPRLRVLPPSSMYAISAYSNAAVQPYDGRFDAYRGFTDPTKAVRAPGRKLKVALLFSGQPRSLEGAGYLSHKWFMDNYDVDVFAHFWYAPGVIQSTSAWSMPDSISFDESVPATFERLYAPRRVTYEPPLTDEYLDGQAARFQFTTKPQVPRNTLSYYTSTERTIALFEQYQREQGAAATQYDWIIRSRPDYVLCKHPNLTVLEPGYLYFQDVQPVGTHRTRTDWIMQSFTILPGDDPSVTSARRDPTRASALVLRPGVCQGCASTFMRIIHSIDANLADGIVMNDEQQVFEHLRRSGLLPKTRLLGLDAPGCLQHFSRDGTGPDGTTTYVGQPATDIYEAYRAYGDPYRIPPW